MTALSAGTDALPFSVTPYAASTLLVRLSSTARIYAHIIVKNARGRNFSKPTEPGTTRNYLWREHQTEFAPAEAFVRRELGKLHKRVAILFEFVAVS